MSHVVTGLIGSQGLLEGLAIERSLPNPVGLPQGFGFIPLPDEILEGKLGAKPGESMVGWIHYSESLEAWLKGVSIPGSVMYFETEYFGGAGIQAAVVLRDGNILYGPESGKIGPINAALQVLGVVIEQPSMDEFDTLGLSRYRATAAWLGR